MWEWLNRLIPVREVEVYPADYVGLVREHRDAVDDLMLAHYTLDRMGVPKSKDRKSLLRLHERLYRLQDDIEILTRAVAARNDDLKASEELEVILDKLCISRVDENGFPLNLEQRLKRVPSIYSAWVRVLLEEKRHGTGVQDSEAC